MFSRKAEAGEASNEWLPGRTRAIPRLIHFMSRLQPPPLAPRGPSARLLEDSDAGVRKTAVEAFGGMGRAAIPHAAAIARCHSDEDPEVRQAAVDVVGDLAEARGGRRLRGGGGLSCRVQPLGPWQPGEHAQGGFGRKPRVPPCLVSGSECRRRSVPAPDVRPKHLWAHVAWQGALRARLPHRSLLCFCLWTAPMQPLNG